MKESFGAATNIYLFMVFFIIYVCFFAIALNFAKTYRVKNYVIDVLEQGRYSGGPVASNAYVSNHLTEYFKSVPYSGYDDYARKYCQGKSNCETYGGAVIMKPSSTDNYYRVIVFFKIEFPFLNIDQFYVPISGETITVN